MNKDGTIDFSKLEKQLLVAVEEDAKYQRENDAKFRAVAQKVGSYEEFKDIVAASHLKPLEKKDSEGKRVHPQGCKVHFKLTSPLLKRPLSI